MRLARQFGRPLRLCLLAVFFLLCFPSTAVEVAAVSEVSGGLSKLARRYAKSRSAANFDALNAYANQATDAERGLALLALGMGAYESKDYGRAAQTFERSAGHAGSLEDYAAYYRARSLVLDEQFEAAIGPLRAFTAEHSSSRFTTAVSRLLVESLIRLERLDSARELLADSRTPLDEAVRWYLTGRVDELRGEKAAAIKDYRVVYYRHPLTDQAVEAQKRLDELRRQLGTKYPKATATERLARADLLFSARSYTKASAEFGLALGAGLEGVDKERAEVRKGAADYHRRWTNTAYTSLTKLKVTEPALDAERFYFVAASARRKGLTTRLLATVNELGEKYPRSPWYEEALFAVGNHFLVRNQPAEYRVWYGRLAKSFPEGKYSAKAHWKICWQAYLEDDPRTRQLLEEHVLSYAGESSATAMYWLGRVAEGDGEVALARGLYDTIAKRFPNYYYATMARTRLSEIGAAGASDLERAEPFTKNVTAPRRISTAPRTATARLIERGATLYAIGLDESASKELLTLDYLDHDAPHIGLELSRQRHEQGDYFRAMRLMKRYGYGYLRFPIEALPREFWEYLYPLGWEDRLRARAEPHELDPYLVAALIRQESEFNPSAKSRSGALGLMQVMPTTGKWLFGRLGIPNYSNRKLTQPDVSLRLGTFHLKNVIKHFNGNLEFALAGYNAGEHRVDQWLERGEFDEPGKFVETIPFSETRGYVQAVLRNREMYQRLYGSGD